MDIADIVRQVVGQAAGGGQPQPSAVNPSGYSQATPTGTDPTQPGGGALRDRFHQVRGNEYQMTEGTPLAQKLAAEFLQSRGAPVNAQNLAVAQQYLRGGALGAMEQQQSTENEIADAAIAADAGASAGGGAAPTPTTGTPPPARPMPTTDAPVDAPVADEGSGDKGGLPWLLAAPALRTLKDPRVPPIEEISNADGTPKLQPGVAERAAAEAAAAAATPKPADVVPDQRAAPVAAAEQPNPYAGQTEDAATRPIETEEVINAPRPRDVTTVSEAPKNATQVGSVGGKNGEVPLMRGEDGKFYAQVGNEWITAKDRSALRKAILRAF